jgi:hypothetical protein
MAQEVQHANLPDDSSPLDKAEKKFIQEVTRVFLYLTCAVDSRMPTTSAHLQPNKQHLQKKMMQTCLQFLDYAASQEDAIITYQASNMILTIQSDASYLSEPKARSRAGGHMFMAGTEDILINNGAVLNILQVIRAVMSYRLQRQNWAHCSSTPKQQSRCNAHSRKWDTCKLAPPSKPSI